jgi:ribosomal protein S21
VNDPTDGRLQPFRRRWQSAASVRKRREHYESSHGKNRQTCEEAKHASQALG